MKAREFDRKFDEGKHSQIIAIRLHLYEIWSASTVSMFATANLPPRQSRSCELPTGSSSGDRRELKNMKNSRLTNWRTGRDYGSTGSLSG